MLNGKCKINEKCKMINVKYKNKYESIEYRPSS